MRKLVLSLLSAILLSLTLAAQTTPSKNVAQIFVNQIKPGTQQSYEQGRKRHMNWHRGQNDTWAWYVWQTATGEDTGSYLVGSFDHEWKDFDGRAKFEAADNTDAAAQMGAYEVASPMMFYARRDDLSLTTGPLNYTAPLVSVTHFMLQPDGTTAFTDAVKQVGDGIRKTNYPAKPSHWYQLMNGGPGPHFVLVSERQSWADFQPLDKTLEAMMTEAYGADQGAAILSSLRKAIRSTRTEALQYRPDLSYVPAGK